MSTVDTASYFFALLALLSLGAVALLAIGAVGRLVDPGRLAVARVELGRASVGVAFLVALVATGGSLYYSEVADYLPCKLCWFQRICMYPLALILGVAALRRDRGVRWYALPLAGVGFAIAAYHTWLQAYPPEGGSSFCTADASCVERYVWEFGFVSLPFMAMSGFALIIALMLLARPTEELTVPGAVADEPGVAADERGTL